MDIESDESERWEDFFGSSTDLGPSVIEYYDRLSSGASVAANVIFSQPYLTEKAKTAAIATTASKIETSNKFPIKKSILDKIANYQPVVTSATSPPPTTAPPKKLRNFNVLSQNVQRMVNNGIEETSSSSVEKQVDDSHFGAAAGLSASHNSLNCKLTPNNSSIIKNYHKIKQHKFRHSQINIPLSKNTSKLTQAGNELVDTYDSMMQSCSSSESLSGDHRQQFYDVKEHLSDFDEDNEKTPTNNVSFLYNDDRVNEISELQNKIQLKKSETFHHSTPIVNRKFSNCTDTSNIVNRKYSSFSEIDKSGEEKMLKKREESDNNSDDEHFEECITEANNFCVKYPPELTESVEYFRSLSIKERKAKLFGSTSPEIPKLMEKIVKHTPTSPIELETKSIQSTPVAAPAPTTDSCKEETFLAPSKVKYNLLENKKKSPEKISPQSPFSNKSLTIPDIARPEYRPLSTSSICSTWSSSSSGSEHLAEKLAISYLASVESLADHSENEQLLQANSNLTLCERACREIVDSERTYCNDLGQIIKGYIENWIERDCLQTDQMKILFSNIQDVYEFNSILLKQLINSANDPIKIAKCFLAFEDRFDAYTIYCTSYPEAISLLTSLLQASDTNALLTSTQKMLQHTLPLGSYLLIPVQRIMRYHLLLENLRKRCDYPEIVQAHVLMKKVARNINQVKKNLEQISRVKELSGILDGWPGPQLTVLGDLKMEDLLMESNKARYVLLFQKMLIITKKKEDNRLQFKSFIQEKDLMLIEHISGAPTSFIIIPYNDPHPTQIKLTAKNRDQKREWAKHIKQVMLDHLDIPSRAKELVYKLGDEEERTTPDKNNTNWKWGTNSSQTSTPEYLERRNQYRRSEMRYRSKKQRKTISSSISMIDGFDKSSAQGKSVDDSAIMNVVALSKKPATCDHRNENCDCGLVKKELLTTLTRKNAVKGDSRSRSKSEPRITDIFLNKHNRLVEDEAGSMKKQSSVESLNKIRLGKAAGKVSDVKMYNTKTLPKRIANLKKQRAKSMKETSKFYMDLPLDIDTSSVLRITESTENLADKVDEKEDGSTESSAAQPTNKRDAEIISDLLKEQKELFDRILKKPPKKKSFDNGKLLSSNEDNALPDEQCDPQTKPDEIDQKGSAVDVQQEPPEPIYESLLRNVHVPYKYSPVLSRSISQQHYKIKTPVIKRPESDYVTLQYTETGQLKFVDEHAMIASLKDDSLQLRNSDSNINYNKLAASRRDDEGISSGSSGNLDRQNSFNSSKQDIPLMPRSRKNTATSQKSNRLSDRRVSDVGGGELFHQNIIHKQGSETLGSRIAHIDYADPKTLFASSSQSNILINKNSVKPQRDSVFSLTSSNDSVNDGKNTVQKVETTNMSDSFYEQSVEDTLENDGFFRDSAIYSDDNERCRGENIYDTPGSPPPLPGKNPPKVPKKPLRSPPPLPATKPSPALCTIKSDCDNNEVSEPNAATDESNNNNVLQATTTLTTSDCVGSKSWVSKQIQNFEH